MVAFEKDNKYLNKSGSWQSKLGIIISKVGIMPVPYALLLYGKKLGVKGLDFPLIGYLLMRKQNNQWPYISIKKLSRESGIHESTIHGSLRRLRAAGLLETFPCKEKNPMGKRRNVYDLSGLIERLNILIDSNKGQLLKMENWSRSEIEEYKNILNYKKYSHENTKTVAYNKPP